MNLTTVTIIVVSMFALLALDEPWHVFQTIFLFSGLCGVAAYSYAKKSIAHLSTGDFAFFVFAITFSMLSVIMAVSKLETIQPPPEIGGTKEVQDE